MKIILMILGYLKWHYGKAIVSLSRIWKNFLFFVFEFFSIKLLLRNFFDPWKKMADSYPERFSFKGYFFTFLTNVIVRLVGMIMRAILIIIGLACYVLLALLYPVALTCWIGLPVLVIILIGDGLLLIIE